jgi:hypothetical protein
MSFWILFLGVETNNVSLFQDTLYETTNPNFFHVLNLRLYFYQREMEKL